MAAERVKRRREGVGRREVGPARTPAVPGGPLGARSGSREAVSSQVQPLKGWTLLHQPVAGRFQGSRRCFEIDVRPDLGLAACPKTPRRNSRRSPRSVPSGRRSGVACLVTPPSATLLTAELRLELLHRGQAASEVLGELFDDFRLPAGNPDRLLQVAQRILDDDPVLRAA